MYSKIAKAIKLKNQPIAVYRTDIKEDNVLQFKEGVWGLCDSYVKCSF
ncbi:Uncharacterised ArCR, COG2043 [Megamonas hypermegale ART12/1]|nr:Uncharacterised ArCR, COG2043 [Megamonas hypermegale ART12/1]